MKKIFCIIILLSVVCAAFAAQTATIKEINGKVKIKLPGKDWEIAAVNMEISKGTTISTSFKSEAVLDLGSSYITVKPLTRMKLEELLEREDTIETDIYLNFGKVSAEVKTAGDKTHDFKLKSPVSTAAVRGTKFDYDMFSVLVENGIVFFMNKINQGRSITKGGKSFTGSFDLPGTMKELKTLEFWVSPTTGDALFPVNTGPDSTGSLEIEW
ncbi:MAG: FecR domain-containing protein [Spirochaetales bacterium]|nr:FecR domain-containing protein [Spirochaetales bacterium]